MPAITNQQSQTVRIQIGSTLTLSLGTGATATLVELDGSSRPGTPVVITLNPTVLGPFTTVKTYTLIANGGTVTYTLGAEVADPSSVAAQVLSQSGVQVTAPADTNENILATISVPAGAMGVNGSVRVWALWSMNNNAGVKTLRVRFGGIAGTVYGTFAGASLVHFTTLTRIHNRGALNSQVGANDAINGLGSGTTALVTSSVDSSAAVDIVLTGQKATGGDTIRLEAYCVEIVPDFN